MAINDDGFPPILAQKHYAQPSAFTPENLLRETLNQMGRIDGDFENGEADGSYDTLQLIAIAADRLRSRLP